jgi:hypothetical protein
MRLGLSVSEAERLLDLNAVDYLLLVRDLLNVRIETRISKIMDARAAFAVQKDFDKYIRDIKQTSLGPTFKV